MNERIQELAEQAWDSARDEIGSFVNDGGEVNWDFLHTYDKKFAESIVKECISIAKLQRHNMQFLASNPPQSAAAYDIERNIMNHFGVES